MAVNIVQGFMDILYMLKCLRNRDPLPPKEKTICARYEDSKTTYH